MHRKLENKSFLFKIIVSKLNDLICLYEEENTCHRKSMCQQTVLKFYIALKETLSN